MDSPDGGYTFIDSSAVTDSGAFDATISFSGDVDEIQTVETGG